MATKKQLNIIEVNNDKLLKDLLEIKEIQAQKKLLEEKEKSLKKNVMATISMYNENVINVNDTLELNASISVSITFDSKTFKKENEALYNQYKTKENLRQNFIIKELKEG